MLRGVSGSGKSTLSKKLTQKAAKESLSWIICSADDFFIKDNKYSWSGSFISNAHMWCKGNTFKAMFDEIDVIIVDNTAIDEWTYYEYIDNAIKHGYEWEIKEPTTEWKYNVEECSKRNAHGVGQATITKMLKGIEDLPTKQLIKNLKEKFHEKA